MEDINKVVSNFAIKGKVLKIEECGNGHINGTYKVTTDCRKYILQRINSTVFADINSLMNNLIRVTEHLLEKNIFTVVFKPSFDGKMYVNDNESYYRIYKYIDNSICYEGIENHEIVEKAGSAFGIFHKNLSDLDVNKFVEIIPNFHNTPSRYSDLLKSIENNPVNRVKECKEIITFLNENKSEFNLLMDAIDNKEIPVHITHNDPKINNVLFDKITKEVKAVIDLDTVMPGSVLFDFGDALRSLFTGNNEDSKDLSKLKCNLDVYKAYLKGYYSSMKGELNKKEIELLPHSVLIMTLELVIRFIKDYIDGDIYFKTNYDKHNLDRANTQLALSKDIIAHFDELVQITNEICK